MVFFLYQNFVATIAYIGKKLIYRHEQAYFMIQRISLQIAALVSLLVVRVNDKRSKKPTIKENRSNRWNIKDTRSKRNILSNG